MQQELLGPFVEYEEYLMTLFFFLLGQVICCSVFYIGFKGNVDVYFFDLGSYE